MKVTKFFKTIVLSVLVAAILSAAFTLAGCDEELPLSEQINIEVDRVIEFLTNTTANNYTHTAILLDGSVYNYYTEGGKVKIEEGGETTYYAQENGEYYKIYKDGDTWRRTDDVPSDFIEPEKKLQNLATRISGIPWTSYDKKTNTLIYEYYDESITAQLYKNELKFVYNVKEGTNPHTIHRVGTTTVTLPENIIDDSQQE